MPLNRQIIPQPRYWGPSLAISQSRMNNWGQRQHEADRQYDLEFFDRYGYFPEQQQQVGQAQDAAQAEYEQLVQEIQAAVGRLDDDSFSKQIRDQFSGIMSGQDQPYGAGDLNALVSEAVAPIMGGAGELQSRLRDSFAARGLGRTGGLGSLESQIWQDAMRQSAMQSSGLRSRAALENFAARERAGSAGAQFFNAQSGQRNALIGQLANFRAQKSFDPSFFSGGRNQNYQPPGANFSYSPPPPIERRRVGTSAPRYRFNTLGAAPSLAGAR